MSPTAGYSGTPVHKKLGFKGGMRVLVLKAPDDYLEIVGGGPSVQILRRVTSNLDLVHLFLRTRRDFQKVPVLFSKLNAGGALWLSWAKKSSPLHNGITEDDLRREVLPLGWVDTKVCAVDEDWSGLKFLKRKT